jgi:hypothetical protein
MSDDDSFGSAVLFIIVVAFALIIGACTGRDELRKDAVKAGVAEFRASPDGDVTFHWKEPAK